MLRICRTVANSTWCFASSQQFWLGFLARTKGVQWLAKIGFGVHAHITLILFWFTEIWCLIIEKGPWEIMHLRNAISSLYKIFLVAICISWTPISLYHNCSQHFCVQFPSKSLFKLYSLVSNQIYIICFMPIIIAVDRYDCYWFYWSLSLFVYVIIRCIYMRSL